MIAASFLESPLDSWCIDYSRNFQSNVETITFGVTIPQGVDEALLRGIADEIPELTHLAIR